MSNPDKWKMFKNYMHNELGISKEDIKGWIRQAVDRVAEEYIARYFERNPVRQSVARAIEAQLKKTYDRDFKAKLLKSASAELVSRLVVTVKEKGEN